MRGVLQKLKARRFNFTNKTIAVITTYSGQGLLLRQVIDNKILMNNHNQEVNVYTIDKSQGQERDIIILSIVRSNSERKLGFVSDRRRINVALTRAKYGLIIVCNTHMLEAEKRTWRFYVDWARNLRLIKDAGFRYSIEDK